MSPKGYAPDDAPNGPGAKVKGKRRWSMPNWNAQARLLAGGEALSEYTFNTRTARHLFCRHCGIRSFYVPRSHPDGFSIDARCLDPATVASVAVVPFDDADRDAATAAVAHLSHG